MPTLSSAIFHLNRLDEARATIEEAQAEKLDSLSCSDVYTTCLLAERYGRDAEQVAWSAGKPGMEDWILYSEADTAAYSGRLEKVSGVFSPGGGFSRAGGRARDGGSYEADAALQKRCLAMTAEVRQRATCGVRTFEWP